MGWLLYPLAVIGAVALLACIPAVRRFVGAILYRLIA